MGTANRDALDAALVGLGGAVQRRCTNRGTKLGQLCAVNTDCDTTPGSGVCKGGFVSFAPPVSAADRCTTFANITVPLRQVSGRWLLGRKTLTLTATPSNEAVTNRKRVGDTDTLTLMCKPRW